MRPIDKGEAPDKVFAKYPEAEPYLEERLGAYCSFCEFPIQHVPEVEHKEAKGAGGAELDWDNLLLSCKYCNTRKGKVVAAGEKEQYLWPDEDDTFHVFSYETEIPVLNKEFLKTQETEIEKKAQKLYDLIKYGNIPISPSDRDRRYMKRNEARNYAMESKAGWEKVKETEDKEIYFKQIIRLAQATGFFSTWMEVFKDDIEVKKELVKSFKGTKEFYFSD